VSDGRLFIGSSVTGALMARDAATGATLWTFYSNGPIRFAPAIADERVYLASDDGALYCLDAATGELLWKKQGGPSAQMCLGNGKLISRWPARGGPVVADGRVYFAAGIWPSDGVYVHALDARTGDSIWSNGSSGGLLMPQPHRGADAESGVAAQGYLAVDDKQLYVPTGRAVPAVFNRDTGRFSYFHLQANRAAGGYSVMLAKQVFANGGQLFRQKGGRSAGKAAGALLVDHPDGLVACAGKSLSVSPWASETKVAAPTHRFALPHTALSMIVAGSAVITGADGAISINDLKSGKATWKAELDGKIYGLAIADGRLYASSDTGRLSCFAPGEAPAIAESAILPAAAISAEVRALASEILATAEVNAGYCVDLNAGDGQLAQAIAAESAMQVVAIAHTPSAADALRERMIAAGIYGSRVSVVLAETDDTPLPDYMASLVVSSDGKSPAADRLLRPWGGVSCFGTAGALQIFRRGALEGAGQWTHQYADPGNTVCSDDTLVGGSLGMLWFNDLRQQMTQRHGRGPAPLVYKGIIYSEGLNGLIAVDAYTGRKLWEVALPGVLKAYNGDHLMGTSGSGSNYCVAESGVYVRMDDRCIRLDRLSGERLNTFTAPGRWGYIAVIDGVLLGSVADKEHVVTFRYRAGGDMGGQLTESKSIFALDAITGEPKWTHNATHSLRHNSIAASGGRVMLIDRPAAAYDRVRGAKPNPEARPGRLLALDLETGAESWAVDSDIYGTAVAISDAHQSVVMGYQPTRFSLASELGGRVSVFDLATGEKRWEKSVDYGSRLIVNDKTIYAQGAAMDLLSGEPRPFNFRRSYGCGVMASARDLMVFRSATLGYFDLKKNDRVRDFGGIRPGCWINVIPANGLVLAPDASAGCSCSYLNRAWIALQPNRTPERPIISPASGSFATPPTITLKGAGTIFYTLDGSSPTAKSLPYREPIVLQESSQLKCLAIVDGNPSPVREAEFRINPSLLSVAATDWRVIDTKIAANSVSNWKSDGGAWSQRGNIFSSTPETLVPDSAVERPGTFLEFTGPALPAERTISLSLRSGDNDAIGIAFAFTDAEHYTLWAMNAERKYRCVLQKAGESITQLGSNSLGYTPGEWYDLRITQTATLTQIFVNDALEFELRTPQSSGTIALYAWGNSDCLFRDLEVAAPDQK
jgi:outer membrane protein assembly factor BamB